MQKDEVARIMKKLGVSIPEFAELMGVHPVSVYRWLSGKVRPNEPTAKLMRMLAKEKASA